MIQAEHQVDCLCNIESVQKYKYYRNITGMMIQMILDIKKIMITS